MSELLNITDTAIRLNITHKTLIGYLRQDGAPKVKETKGRAKLYDLEEVKPWVEAHAKSDRTAVGADESLVALKRRRLKIQCGREQLAWDADKGKYYDATRADATADLITKTFWLTLQRRLLSEEPEKCVGLDVISIRERLTAALSDCMKTLNLRETWYGDRKAH